ncbi:MAG: nucleotidyltransferase domain-containing protein [Vulcanimicrobiota bacterium]
MAADSVPITVWKPLETCLEELKSILSQDLLAVVLYGSAARGDFAAGTSDLNLMVVTRSFSTHQLREVTATIQAAWRAVRLDPFILTLEELRRSADVFPLRYHEIKSCYRLLAGEDVLEDIFVHDEHLRLACEREAKQMVLRLRQLYMLRAGLRPALRETLISTINPFLRLLAVALQLTGKNPPEDLEQMLELASRELEVPADALFRVWSLRFSTQPTEEAILTGLYEQFIECAVGLASYVDRLGV